MGSAVRPSAAARATADEETTAPRRARAAVLGTFAVTVAALAAPGAAMADACPNAALRTGPSALLPDCRAYEQVTPVDKGGNSARFGINVRQEGGSAVAYDAVGAFPGSGAGASLTAKYVSRRTASGWVTASLNPPTPSRPPTVNDEFFLVGLSADLSRGLIDTRYPSDELDQDPSSSPTSQGYRDLYLSEPGAPVRWISHGPTLPDAGPFDARFAGASSDLGRIVFQSGQSFTPETAGASGQHIYRWADGALETINVDDDGDLIPGGAGVGMNAASGGGFPRQGAAAEPTAVSADGSTVFFTAPLDNSAPRQVYVRTGGRTVMVSRSQAAGTAGQPAPGGARFAVAARDGSRVVFFSASQLTDGAPAGGGLYRFDLPSGDLTFLTAVRPGRQGVIAATPDLSLVYACTGTTGNERISLVRGDAVSVIATTGCSIGAGDPNLSTPNAGYVFTSSDSLTGQPTNGRTMAYLYDAQRDTLICVSCRRDGSPPQGDATLIPQLNLFSAPENARNLTEDGNRVYFGTTDALVERDVNGTTDVYQWERDGTGSCTDPAGCVSLISDGVDRDGAGFVGASADGSDVYIVTYATLVSTDSDGQAADVYVAKVGGGFAPPADSGPGSPPPAAGPGTVPARPGLASAAPQAPWTPNPQPAPQEPSAPQGTVDLTSRSATADGRSVEVAFEVPGAGELGVALTRGGRTVAEETVSVDEAGRATVALRLTRRERARLERRGRVQVVVRSTFTPAGGAGSPVEGETRLTLSSGSVAIVDRGLRVRGNRARTTVAVGGAGEVSARIRADGSTLARGQQTVDRAGRVRVTLRLTRAGRRAVADGGEARGRLVVRLEPSGQGEAQRDGARVVLETGGR